MMFEVQLYVGEDRKWVPAKSTNPPSGAVFSTVDEAVKYLNWFSHRRPAARLQVVQRTEELLDLRDYVMDV